MKLRFQFLSLAPLPLSDGTVAADKRIAPASLFIRIPPELPPDRPAEGGADATEAGTCSLNVSALAALRQFFQLMDEWDQKEKYREKPQF
jgi:hypothetical protein